MTAAAAATAATATAVGAFALVALLRVLVGYQPHSGQDNYHGSSRAYGGDYEAQRHWMELTLHLSVGDWYWYDPEYWGLDYPPLTAYLSWACGYLSHRLVGPETVALESSRGYENDPTHKAFMRATVLASDLLMYGTAVWRITERQQQSGDDGATTKDLTKQQQRRRLFAFFLAMSQPAIVLIDHGHFQYNATALGLSLWAFYYASQRRTVDADKGIVIGSIFFCCALSFKQMTLYYAPAMFFYLLGRCFSKDGRGGREWFRRLFLLAITVVGTFALLWWPFAAYGPTTLSSRSGGASTTPAQRLGQVLHRILPFQRGLFEGKVSNLWCALSVKPVKIRNRIPVELQPVAALAATVLLVAPSCYKLFQVGRRTTSLQQQKDCSVNIDDLVAVLWGTTSCALAFFLASFQVHEKSLLLALAPATLLLQADDKFVKWFSIATTWTLWPLLVIDRLQTAYACVLLIFFSFLRIGKVFFENEAEEGYGCFFDRNVLTKMLLALSYMAMIGLHVMEQTATVPERFPDLFPVLWSVVGCGFCCLAWLISCYHLYYGDDVEILLEHEKLD